MLQLNFKLIHLNRVLIFPLFSNTHCVSHIHIHTHTHQQFSLFLDRWKWKRADSIQFRIYVRQIPEIFRNADVTCDMSHVKGTLTIVMQPKKRVNEMKKGGKKEEEKIDVGKIGTCVYTLRSETVCKNDTYTMTLAVIIVVVVAFVVVVAIVDFASLVLCMTKTHTTIKIHRQNTQNRFDLFVFLFLFLFPLRLRYSLLSISQNQMHAHIPQIARYLEWI